MSESTEKQSIDAPQAARPEVAKAVADQVQPEKSASKAERGKEADKTQAETCGRPMHRIPAGAGGGAFRKRKAHSDRVSSAIGTGVGRALVQHAIAQAGSLGAARVIIQGDPNASDFYIAAGGRQIGSREAGSIEGRFLPLFEIALR